MGLKLIHHSHSLKHVLTQVEGFTRLGYLSSHPLNEGCALPLSIYRVQKSLWTQIEGIKVSKNLAVYIV